MSIVSINSSNLYFPTILAGIAAAILKVCLHNQRFNVKMSRKALKTTLKDIWLKLDPNVKDATLVATSTGSYFLVPSCMELAFFVALIFSSFIMAFKKHPLSNISLQFGCCFIIPTVIPSLSIVPFCFGLYLITGWILKLNFKTSFIPLDLGLRQRLKFMNFEVFSLNIIVSLTIMTGLIAIGPSILQQLTVLVLFFVATSRSWDRDVENFEGYCICSMVYCSCLIIFPFSIKGFILWIWVCFLSLHAWKLYFKSQLNIKELTCSICLAEYGKHHKPYILPCGHSFCYRCIEMLKNKCPTCRASFYPHQARQNETHCRILRHLD